MVLTSCGALALPSERFHASFDHCHDGLAAADRLREIVFVSVPVAAAMAVAASAAYVNYCPGAAECSASAALLIVSTFA